MYVSAFRSARGVPFELWRRAAARQFVLLVSPEIINEIADALRRRVLWRDTEITERLRLIARLAEIVQPQLRIEAVFADPDDDRILVCALAGGADLIVSGDRHLTALKTFRGIAMSVRLTS